MKEQNDSTKEKEPIHMKWIQQPKSLI